MSVKTRSSKVATDGNLIASQVFSKVFQAYLECSDKVQAAIRDMSQIVNDPNADPDESDAALATIAEALFPTRDNGTLGVDSESLAPADAWARALQRAEDILRDPADSSLGSDR